MNTLETKTIEIDGTTYHIRRPNFGIDNQILDASSSIELDTGRIVLKTGTRRHATVKLCVVKPEMTDKKIEQLSVEAGMKLFIEIERFRSPLPLSEKPNSSADTEDSKPAKTESKESSES